MEDCVSPSMPAHSQRGPGPNDPNSLVWLYHSHGNEGVESGLVGPIIITARGQAALYKVEP
jgi:hypothetical protein